MVQWPSMQNALLRKGRNGCLDETEDSTTSTTTENSPLKLLTADCLTVSPVGLGVEALPGLPAAGVGLVVSVTLVHATRLLASGGETTALTVLKMMLEIAL